MKGPCPRPVSKEEWPPSSPDFNVLDNCIWSVLETKALSTPARYLDVLKRRLEKAWAKINQSMLCAAVDDFPRRLRAVRRAERNHF